jgi:hypothetical protein
MIQQAVAAEAYRKIDCEDTSAASAGYYWCLTPLCNLPATYIAYLSLFTDFLSILQKNISPGN